MPSMTTPPPPPCILYYTCPHMEFYTKREYSVSSTWQAWQKGWTGFSIMKPRKEGRRKEEEGALYSHSEGLGIFGRLIWVGSLEFGVWWTVVVSV